MKKKIQDYDQLKQDDQSYCSKFLSLVYLTFLGEKNIEPQINRSIIANTYIQITEVIHIVTLYSVFASTNNLTYSLIQSIFASLLILIFVIPRVSKNHYYTFYTTGILVLVVSLGSLVLLKILIDNYITFQYYCNTLTNYYQRNPGKTFSGKTMCLQIDTLYKTELVIESLYSLFRGVYLVIIVKGYKVAKGKYDQQEKKRRRKDRYNQMLKKRSVLNSKRRV